MSEIPNLPLSAYGAHQCGVNKGAGPQAHGGKDNFCGMAEKWNEGSKKLDA